MFPKRIFTQIKINIIKLGSLLFWQTKYKLNSEVPYE